MLPHTEVCHTLFKFTYARTKLGFHSSGMSHRCGPGLDLSDVWRPYFVWAQVNLNKVCTSNNWSDPTRSTSMWHHTGVKPQLCLSPGEFKQSSQTSDGTQPSPHRCCITLRCVMLCLNSPALGPSCGFSPVWNHIDVDLVGSHPMLDVHTLFQFAWAKLQFMYKKTNKNVCRNLRPPVCL